MSKTIKIYKISRGYKSCTVWEGSPMTRARIAEHTTTPTAKDKQERHAHIAGWLFQTFGIPGPVFKPDF
jgi:hypothetical protein